MVQTTRTLIKGGTVVTAVDTYLADVAIVDDHIAAIFGPNAAPPGGKKGDGRFVKRGTFNLM